MSDVGQPVEVRAVALHLLGLAQAEIVEMTRRESVGHVHQQQLRPGQPGERRHVRENRLIRGEFSIATRMRRYMVQPTIVV